MAEIDRAMTQRYMSRKAVLMYNVASFDEVSDMQTPFMSTHVRSQSSANTSLYFSTPLAKTYI